MKTSSIVLLLAALSLGAVTALADRGTRSWDTLRNETQFRQLKAGDKVVYVCLQCQTVTEQTVGSQAQAMEHCKEGATLTCPSCRSQVRIAVKLKQYRNDPVRVNEVYYVNAKGEECFFVARPVPVP